VVYVTSMQAVKETYTKSLEIRKILQRARVAFEERDIALDSKFNKELLARIPGAPKVPQLFLNGKHVGVRFDYY
jgi:glutaredoxin